MHVQKNLFVGSIITAFLPLNDLSTTGDDGTLKIIIIYKTEKRKIINKRNNNKNIYACGSLVAITIQTFFFVQLKLGLNMAFTRQSSQ